MEWDSSLYDRRHAFVFKYGEDLLALLELLKDDPERLNVAFLNVLGFVTTISVGAALGVAVIAEDLVPALLGRQWIEAVPLIQCLAIFGAIRTIYGGAGNLLVVQGRTRLLAGLTGTQMILTVIAAVVGMHAFGVIGVALAKLATAPLFFLMLFYSVTRVSSITRREIGAQIWRPAVAGLTMVVVVKGLAVFAPANHFGALAFEIALGAAVYTATTYALWRSCGRPLGAESFMLGIAAKALAGRGRP